MEDIFTDAGTTVNLDRNLATKYNILTLLPDLYTIFTITELFADPSYNPTAGFSGWNHFIRWWNKNGQ